MVYVDVFGDQAARQEMERQRREEWERGKKEELSRRRTGEQEEISRLRAKKRSLELELEAVVRPAVLISVFLNQRTDAKISLPTVAGQQAQADLRPPPRRSEQEVDSQGGGGPHQPEEGHPHLRDQHFAAPF